MEGDASFLCIFMRYPLIIGFLRIYTEIWRHVLNAGEIRRFLLFDVYAVVAYNEECIKRSNECHNNNDTS